MGQSGIFETEIGQSVSFACDVVGFSSSDEKRILSPDNFVFLNLLMFFF